MSFFPSRLPSRCARQFARKVVGLLSIATASLIAACGDNDITGIASVENTTDTVRVYALSGTQMSLPAAYYFVTQSLVRPQILSTGGVNFEVAFDIAADGRAMLLPAVVVVPDAPKAVPLVGMQKQSGSFESVERAPDRDYVLDSVIYAQVGEVVVLQLLTSGCTYGEPIYAKVGIDSIITAERRIVFRTLINRNCGFRGLKPGLPTN